MCGIVGLVSQKNKGLKFLIDGLEKLEYRGYDSAGIAYIHNDKLEIINNKLKDKDYFSVYVKDKYQYSSNDDSIIPIN